MKYKKSIPEFVEAMAELVEHKVSGHVVLITEMGDWGKFLIGDGMIYSLSLADHRGVQVLEYLKPLDEIQFMFRPDKGDDCPTKPSRHHEAGAAAMDNARFFGFFDHVLPKSGAHQQALQNAGSRKHGSPKTKGTVLVVDDSALARKVVCNILIASGYQVAEAKDGFEAMGQLENVHPDLVVLDLIMPRMDGYQVVEMMKKNPLYQKLPVIMLTSRDSLMDKLKGKISASDAYITKPVKEEELLMHISRHLG